MKKASLALTILVIISVGIVYFTPSGKHLFQPKSERLYNEYYAHLKTLNERRFLEEPAYREEYNDKGDALRKQVIEAAIHEKNYARAVPLLEDIVQDLGKEKTKYGFTFPISKPQVELRALYCEELAKAQDGNGEIAAAQKTRAKCERLQATAKRMK